jgi:hypothetical protein
MPVPVQKRLLGFGLLGGMEGVATALFRATWATDRRPVNH